MTIYDLIYEEINDRYENGELTLEQANEVNDLAYDKYVLEDKSDIKRFYQSQLYNISGKETNEDQRGEKQRKKYSSKCKYIDPKQEISSRNALSNGKSNSVIMDDDFENIPFDVKKLSGKTKKELSDNANNVAYDACHTEYNTYDTPLRNGKDNKSFRKHVIKK